MKKNRTFYNLITGVVLQLAVAISGIVIPKLIMSSYGSTINGLIISINQLISYLALVEAGVGAVGIVALYSPLANKNEDEVSSVIVAVNNLYKKSGLIYLAAVIVMGFVYPYVVMGQVEAVLVTSMFFILSSSNLIDYLVLGKYKVLLTADEKLYVHNAIQIGVILLNTILTAVFIYLGFDIVFVKSINILLYIVKSLFIWLYVKHSYPYIDFRKKPDYSNLGERWDSLIHQLAAIVVGNTDVLLITLMMGTNSLLEVSVYSTYNMVLVAISGLFGTVSSALQSYFGKLFVTDIKHLNNKYLQLEKVFYPVVCAIFCCTGALLLSFVELYTVDITDVNYYRPFVAAVFVFNGIIQNIRIPGVTLICAKGKFKETRNRAIAEAVINIGMSLLLIPRFGILGALLGTTASYMYRTVDVIFFSNKLLDEYDVLNTFKNIGSSVVLFIPLLLVIYNINNFINVDSWGKWIIAGVVDVVVVFVAYAVLVLINSNRFKRNK